MYYPKTKNTLDDCKDVVVVGGGFTGIEIADELAKQGKNILTKAIKFHNAMTLPPERDDYALFFMKLIRDADKLDIWRVLIEYYKSNNHDPNSTLSLGLTVSEEYSNAILKSLYGSRIACLKDMKTLNDFKLLQISWVYDLNFIPSFMDVYEFGVIKKISETLPTQKKYQMLFNTH